MEPWHNNVYVFDDIIPLEQQEHLKDIMIRKGWWKMYINTPAFPNPRVDNGYRNPGMAFYTVWDKKPVHQFHTEFVPILKEACKRVGKDYDTSTVVTGRAFAQFSQVDGDYTRLNAPHIDRSEKHLVVLYYITNGTGDTVIYENMLDKEKTPDDKDNTDVINRMDFKEKNRVTPKQGRAIVFDGHHWHTSGQPKDMGGLRIIMNYNLV